MLLNVSLLCTNKGYPSASENYFSAPCELFKKLSAFLTKLITQMVNRLYDADIPTTRKQFVCKTAGRWAALNRGIKEEESTREIICRQLTQYDKDTVFVLPIVVAVIKCKNTL